MTSVLTLIAADRLDDSTLSQLRQTLAAQGAAPQPPSWLAPGRVADLAFDGLAVDRAETIARDQFAGQEVDLLAQPREGRRKKLLVADMDSTIVVGETLDELAAYAGLKEHIAAITARAMNGEIDFKGALRERVGLLRGLDQGALAKTERELELMPGARTLIGTMRAHGAFTLLVSGGFDYFTSRVRERCGFDADRANQLEIEEGKLTGKVVEPILDRDAKLGFLRSFAAELGCHANETLAVGDGANDLDMIRAAGLGVAFHAKPVVAHEARFRVEHNDLTALLFAQGYRQEEFSA
jgi:phosphoserine phosphatase